MSHLYPAPRGNAGAQMDEAIATEVGRLSVAARSRSLSESERNFLIRARELYGHGADLLPSVASGSSAENSATPSMSETQVAERLAIATEDSPPAPRAPAARATLTELWNSMSPNEKADYAHDVKVLEHDAARGEPVHERHARAEINELSAENRRLKLECALRGDPRKSARAVWLELSESEQSDFFSFENFEAMRRHAIANPTLKISW